MKKSMVAVSIAASVMVVGCGYDSNDSKSYSSSSSSEQAVPSSASSEQAVVKVALDAAKRSVHFMVDSEGMSLYEFDKDTLNTSNCVGACLDLWPIFSASTTENADFGAINSSHTTYLMHPLYYFANDENAGDIKGDNYNMNVWHLVYPPANFTETADAKLSSGTRTQSYLTNTEGYALYTYDKDEANVSNCTDGCLDIWPIQSGEVDTAKLPEGADATKFGYITRDGGIVQTTYNGLPLYTFASDANPGDTNGDWVKGVWHLVEPGSVDDGNGDYEETVTLGAAKRSVHFMVDSEGMSLYEFDKDT